MFESKGDSLVTWEVISRRLKSPKQHREWIWTHRLDLENEGGMKLAQVDRPGILDGIAKVRNPPKMIPNSCCIQPSND
jgi:hypothetical protein